MITGLSAAEPTGHGELSSDQFKESVKCATCHGIIYAQWDGSMHSNAYTDPFYQEDFKVASADTNGELDIFCSRCHTPIGVTSGEIPPADGSGLSDVAVEGVNCEFCHSVSDSEGIGNAPFILTPGDTKWGPYTDSETAGHESEFLELQTNSEFCGMCHQVIHPVNGIILDDTYTAWKEGPYSQEDVQCQDCHMSPGITKFEANPGRAGSGGPKRDHISLHYFVGANAFVTDILGEDDHRDMAIKRLEKAATMEVIAPQNASPSETVNINISITNSGAGHKLPTGITELRQMWLEITVIDDSGRMIYSSGALDGEGDIEAGTELYNTVLTDADGNPTEKFWLAESISSDNRIAPRETAFQEHTFIIPEDAEYPLSVDTRLNYRSASQELIDDLFEGNYEVPVIVMAEASDTINDPDAPAEAEPIPGIRVAGLAITFLLGALLIRKGGSI